MNQSVRILSIAVAMLVALAQIPARAQYSTEFVPAKLIKEGTTSTTIAGSGKVVVQVQVNADGSHKVTKIISSTNSGDNAAATEIANSSTYRTARRGTTPITAFYDFTLRFNGRVFVRSSSESSGVSLAGASLTPAANQVAALIRARRYEQAKSKAQLELLSSPGDESLREMLGLAAYDGGDFTTAAAAFDKVATISAQFRAPAAQSFAAAAVKGAADNPQQSLVYAKKAVALVPDTNSHFALGVAQLANNDAASAVASLKAAHDAAMTDSKIPLASKVNIDAELLQAYLANNDEQDAQAIAAAIKQLDPSSTAGARAMGASLLKSGQAAAVAKDTATALHDYEQAAALGDPTIEVTAYVLAAFAVAQSVKPDYKRMQSYADKAIALQPDNAQANFAEGIALAGQWASSHDDGTKKKAADALANADRLAKAGGNEALSLQIETFVKQNLNSGSGAPSGSGP
jgi:tetratricopeptide (TPR) repeat protein